MIKILKKRILSNKGFSYVILSVLMIVILLMGVAIFEIIRINIQAAAVRDKFEDAICVENYSEMYQPIRESHASSYAFNGTRWEERHKANEQYIRTYLNKAMSAGEIMQCEIVSISFDVDSPSVAPVDTDTAKKYAISGSITIKVPYRFAWQELAPISLKLDVKSQWRALF